MKKFSPDPVCSLHISAHLPLLLALPPVCCPPPAAVHPCPGPWLGSMGSRLPLETPAEVICLWASLHPCLVHPPLLSPCLMCAPQPAALLHRPPPPHPPRRPSRKVRTRSFSAPPDRIRRRARNHRLVVAHSRSVPGRGWNFRLLLRSTFQHRSVICERSRLAEFDDMPSRRPGQ